MRHTYCLLPKYLVYVRGFVNPDAPFDVKPAEEELRRGEDATDDIIASEQWIIIYGCVTVALPSEIVPNNWRTRHGRAAVRMFAWSFTIAFGEEEKEDFQRSVTFYGLSIEIKADGVGTWCWRSQNGGLDENESDGRNGTQNARDVLISFIAIIFYILLHVFPLKQTTARFVVQLSWWVTSSRVSM